MKREFLPVGQGAFYIEIFANDFTVVYDCGSYGDIQFITNTIKTSNLKNDIDLLVISHFHEDHINGLEYLFKNYTIKKMLIPYLDISERQLSYIDGEFFNTFYKDFILDPLDALQNHFHKSTEIIFLKPEESSVPKEIEYNNLNNTMNSGDLILYEYNKIKWHYIPFNFQNKNRTKSFFEKTKALPINTIEDFKKFYKENKEEFLNIYENISGDKNTNSLVLLSAPHELHTVTYSKRGDLNIRQNIEACLYLGDYNAKGKRKVAELHKRYEKYFHKLSTIQVPHHGSKNNYNPELNMNNNIISVISAGINNKYEHPHQNTLRQIIQKNGIALIVTEEESSKLIQKIYQRN